jgi:hypothetical protein
MSMQGAAHFLMSAHCHAMHSWPALERQVASFRPLVQQLQEEVSRAKAEATAAAAAKQAAEDALRCELEGDEVQIAQRCMSAPVPAHQVNQMCPVIVTRA